MLFVRKFISRGKPAPKLEKLIKSGGFGRPMLFVRKFISRGKPASKLEKPIKSGAGAE